MYERQRFKNDVVNDEQIYIFQWTIPLRIEWRPQDGLCVCGLSVMNSMQSADPH